MEQHRELIATTLLRPKEVALRANLEEEGVDLSSHFVNQHQQHLINQGYVDDEGLAADGVWSDDWNTANDELENDVVRNLQRQLWAAGFDPGEVDGL